MKRARDEKTKNVNFFLNETNEERVFGNEKPDPNKHYLILQNDTLHAKIMALEQEHITLTKDLEAKEDEIDTFDEQSRYIKGEIKNFVELRKMADEITLLTEEKEEISELLFKNVNNVVHRLGMFILVNKIFVLLTFGLLYYMDMFSIKMVLSCEFIHFINSCIATLTTPQDLKYMADLRKEHRQERRTLEDDIKKLKSEIKRTDESNDIISKYIETL